MTSITTLCMHSQVVWWCRTCAKPTHEPKAECCCHCCHGHQLQRVWNTPPKRVADALVVMASVMPKAIEKEMANIPPPSAMAMRVRDGLMLARFVIL